MDTTNISRGDIRSFLDAPMRAAMSEAVDPTVDIRGTTRIVQDLHLDSLAVMNLMMAVEDQYDVSIDLDMLIDIVTVDDLVDAVLQLVQSHPSNQSAEAMGKSASFRR